MDRIELALSRYTDYFKFEQLCIEVMSYYGFPRIKKIGGYKDDGVDAIESNSYYDETHEKRVFQFTMQKETKSKITDTEKKLERNGVEYDELIIVTSQAVNNIDGLMKSFRLKNQKSLQIFDLSAFVTVVGSHQDLLQRYFPDLNSQIQKDFLNDDYFSDSGEDQLSISMIKSTLLFSLSPDLKTNQQRKDLFDKSVLSVISSVDKGYDITEIMDVFHKKFGKILVDSQVKAALERLLAKGLITKDEEKYKASKKAKQEIMAGIAHIEQRTNALIDDIIAQTHVVASDIKCSVDDDKQMWANIKKTLNLFFKYYGTDLAMDVDSIVSNMVRQEELIRLLKDGIQPDLGECLVYSLGEILSNPSEKQSEVISLWAKAFISTQLMRLDPMLGAFHGNAFKEKVFILDTDFVLNCMVKYGKQSSVYSSLLKELLKIGCKVYITDDVVREVVTHAEFAKRNFNYFENTFEAADESIIYEQLKNVFVIDYYISKKDNEFSNKSFSSYMSNIYDSDDSYNFMLEVMENRLPKGVVIGDDELKKQVGIDVVERDTLTKSIYEETIKTYKAAYRSDNENWQIAKTDAELYLIARGLNKNLPVNKNKMLMDGKAYLITNSNRSIRCAKSNGIFSTVVSKPSVLVALLSEIGWFDASDKSIVDLLGNPFLAEITNQCWDELKVLVDSGVDLRGKELPRLKRELKHVIHDLITQEEDDLENDNDSSFDKEESTPKMEDMEQFVQFTEMIHSKGYKLIPVAETMIENYKQLKSDKEGQEKINERLKEELNKVGKGKQNYIRRVMKNEEEKIRKKK